MKCVGVFGSLFGHKFQSWDGLFSYNFCRRCGIPKGGWK